MPCYTDPPTHGEIVAGQLRELIHEIHGNRHDHRRPGLGDPGDVQALTRILCQWCKDNADKVPVMSLELQMWWRDHQEDDRRHAEEEAARKRRDELRASALAKLSADEIAALKL